jgi:NH3-dependent NAD+ synthetase
MSTKKPVTVAELYAEYNSKKDAAKVLYDKADALLKKLVRAWKKNKQAKIDDEHILEIEDQFRGATKAFAPGFAHRYKLKERAVASE